MVNSENGGDDSGGYQGLSPRPDDARTPAELVESRTMGLSSSFLTRELANSAELSPFQVTWPGRPADTPKAEYWPSTYRRGTAEIIDEVLCLLFSIIVLAVLFPGTSLSDTDSYQDRRFVIVLSLVRIAYETIFVAALGLTIGKGAMGLRIVLAENGHHKLPWLTALIRTLTKRLDIFIGIIPELFAFYRSDRRQLADLLAETQVIQDRPRASLPRPRPIMATLLILGTIISVLGSLYFKGGF